MSGDRAGAFSRRGFLKAGAAASLGTAATAAGMTPAAAADPPAPIPPHGAELRGLDLVVKKPLAEGRFGFMFKKQPPYGASESLLTSLGQTMEEQPRIGAQTTDPRTGQPMVATKDHNDAANENPNPLLTSGFTFLGQFVDHDITFDTTPLSEQQSDPYATTNFRTPRYDLDAIYGRGPSADPQFYDPDDRDKFRLERRAYAEIRGVPVSGELYDVPRDAAGKAVIADPRNDQTLILLQLHVAMQRFHNRLVDHVRSTGVPRAEVFEAARRLARWHYQWVVTHEFLPAVVGRATTDAVYQEVKDKAPVLDVKYYKPENAKSRPFIPVEFSVAAYRFGHSITRPRYTVQDYVTDAGATVAVSSVPLFEAQAGDNNLNGGRPLPPRLKIQWSKFFNRAGVRTARPVRQFDASLATPLFSLPASVMPDSNPMSLLSSRNLLRGRKMGLPSGQQVARLMKVTPLTNAQLWQDHRIEVGIPIPTTGPAANVVQVLREVDVENQSLKQLFADPGWGGEAPLWFYILKEAELAGRGRELGPVGGRIVAEVLVGLLQGDVNAYLSVKAAWKPEPPIAPARGQFTMADLLTYAGVWS